MLYAAGWLAGNGVPGRVKLVQADPLHPHRQRSCDRPDRYTRAVSQHGYSCFPVGHHGNARIKTPVTGAGRATDRMLGAIRKSSLGSDLLPCLSDSPRSPIRCNWRNCLGLVAYLPEIGCRHL